MLPRKNRTATTVFTAGQIFMGAMEVRAPVNSVHAAITNNINEEPLHTIKDARFGGPPRSVVANTSVPMKHSVRPSATHAIAIILLLSRERGPNPFTTAFVGMI